MQGQTIGPNEFTKKAIFHWRGVPDERLWPGIFYVGASRVKEFNQILFDCNITHQDWQYIGLSPSAKTIANEVAKIEAEAMSKRNELLQSGTGTQSDYTELLSWFADYISTIDNNDETYIQHRNRTVNEIRISIDQWRTREQQLEENMDTG